MKTKIYCIFGYFLISTIAIAMISDQRELSRDQVMAIRGQSHGWCHNDNACAAFSLFCDGTCMAKGEECGKEREIEYPESCNSILGNNSCIGQQIQVVCAREWDCICREGIPDNDGDKPLICTRSSEPSSGNPTGDGSTPVKGTITSDPLSCST